MTVFTMHDPSNPFLEVDLFVDPPIPFDELLERSISVKVTGQIIQIVSIPGLITMKRVAGRPQNLADIAALEEIRGLKDKRE